jgi:hypothetical protein
MFFNTTHKASMSKPGRYLLWSGVVALSVSLLACKSGESLTVNGDVPIAYAKRVNTMRANPVNGAPTAPGGDLMVREKSSPSAPEHNITAQFTQGQGDVSGPDVSYDGKKIIFSMHCPVANTASIGGLPACTGRWNIWEYDMSAGGLTGGSFRRITSALDADDVDASYLPGGRGFVFTSNRQTKSFANQALGRSYYALDEYERERVFNLHTMDAKGENIAQISFNQSHDRSPVVLKSGPNEGDIMFSRWDHVGGRNHFKIFRAKPDGTDLFVLYGAHSEGNSFLHPREMDPAGKFKGFVVSDLMPLQRTYEGGGMVAIDAANYSEQNTPANANVPLVGGQRQLTAQLLSIDRGLSQFGRITTPYPLWDGTDRVLLSYTPCEVHRDAVVVSCATLTPAEMARVTQTDRLLADVASDALQDDVPPSYAIYMFDPVQQTFLNVAAPPAGFKYTHPVALLARTEPLAKDPANVDVDLAAQGLGLLEVRSVYDTDGLGRMAAPVLAAADLPAGCSTAIPQVTPTDSLDTRALVADLIRMKDPADPAYRCAPARFVRAVRAVAPPVGSIGMRRAIGETSFEMQQILGYAPIEPDGSFKLTVPADTPIALAVIDDQGRAFQTHTNWIQVRPGERRTCDGCHGPRRGGALNSGVVVNTLPAALLAAMSGAHLPGQTMASTRAALDPSALLLSGDPLFTDVWADASKPGVIAKTALALRYRGNSIATNDLTTATPVNGVINYPDHIQPLWDRNRGTATCIACHGASAKLDLTGTLAGTGRINSYEKLMLGDPLINPLTGLPVTAVQNGVLVIERGPALVDNSASEGEALGLARKSRLIEILSGQSLMADSQSRAAHPNPAASAPNHALMLNTAEKRLLAEWIDLGGQYFNDPFDAASGVRSISGLSETTFEAQVLPILRSTCAASCHQGVGSSNSAVPVGASFSNDRFVLTGDVTGDYNATLTMINNACAPSSNPLLSKPSTVPHPANAAGSVGAVLPLGSVNYNTIAAWIGSGC